jgi:NADH-quinone oxidoreductase subunit M
MLAGVMLKMGAYGFLRIAMPILPGAWRSAAVVIVVLGVLSVVYSAFVALAQTDFKRMIAYTSVTHMGYVVMAAGVIGLPAAPGPVAPAGAGGTGLAAGGLGLSQVALTGAVTQLVSHGLVTGSLFLLAGVLHDRTGSYDMGGYGGLARPAPRFATMLAVAAFAALGLPGFSGFVAEFQIFAGSIGVAPATVLAVPGLLVTAALLVRALQRLLLGAPGARSRGFRDVHGVEVAAVTPLLALVVLIGVAPRPLLDVIEPAATAIVTSTTGQGP